MNGCRLLATCILLATLSIPAKAGIFFNRHPKLDPSQKVSALIVALKTETSERKRAQAAQELRHFDTATFPQIVSALSDAAVNDPQAGVRSEAAQSLAHLRPVSQDAGWALEQVASKDASFRVRFQAKNLLLHYRLAGYRSPKAETPTTTTTTTSMSPAMPSGVTRQEPPLAEPEALPAGTTGAPSVAPVPAPMQTRVITGRPVPIPAPPPADGPDLLPSK